MREKNANKLSRKAKKGGMWRRSVCCRFRCCNNGNGFSNVYRSSTDRLLRTRSHNQRTHVDSMERKKMSGKKRTNR